MALGDSDEVVDAIGLSSAASEVEVAAAVYATLSNAVFPTFFLASAVPSVYHPCTFCCIARMRMLREKGKRRERGRRKRRRMAAVKMTNQEEEKES